MAVAPVESQPVNPAKKHGKVVITLENVLIPPDKLATTPSQHDGLDKETEYDLRITGCELIKISGILLKLPQVAMATGQVLFQRFYYAKSLVRYQMEHTAMACINLASKIEEAPRKIRDVINVFNHIKQVKNGRTIQPVILDSSYIALKSQVIKAERRLLKELGFCCHVKHPHKIIIMYLQLLESANNKKLAQSSWNYMNDAMRTDVFVCYSPETIACSCIWFAARLLKIPLPDSPPWYHIFRVTLVDIEKIAASIMKLYSRKKTKLDVLEARVEEIRKEQQEVRLRNKINPLCTPKEGTTFSPASRANSPKHSARKHSSSPDRHGDKKSESSRRDRSSHSNSNSPRHNRKRGKLHSYSPLMHSPRSRSRSRSRSHSRERYDRKKKYSRTPSPTVTPPPRFTKNKEKGSIVRSVSRSRSRSPLKSLDKYEKYEKYSRYERNDRIHKVVDRYDKYEKIDKSDKYAREDRLDRKLEYKKADKYSKSLEKAEKKKSERELKRDSKKYYDNGYEKHHKSKKSSRLRSRSRDRDGRRR